MIGPVNGLAVGLFGILLRVPEKTYEGPANDLLQNYIEFYHSYFDTDRLENLEHFKRTFDAVLSEKHQDLRHKQSADKSYVVFTEQQAVEAIEICQPLVERMNVSVTRLVSARLKAQVIEDLLVFDNEITDRFNGVVSLQQTLVDEVLLKAKPELSFGMWYELHGVFHNVSVFNLFLDGLLEGTAYRERQRRGEHGHVTTTAAERKMD